MKKIFLKPLCLFLLLMTGLNASAEKVWIDGIHYSLKGNEASVTSVTEGEYSGDIIIPSSVTYQRGENLELYSVIGIDNYAFQCCDGLTSVTIPNSVTTIGESAFEQCSGLTSVTIPNSVKTIGESAFQQCSGLTSVIIGNSVTSIGNLAFAYCSSLSNMTIPASVTTLGDNVFSWAQKIKNFIIEDSPTTLSCGSNGFFSCENFYLGRDITFPTIQQIVDDRIKHLTIGSYVTILYDKMFDGRSMESVDFSNAIGLTSIGSYTFNGSFNNESGITVTIDLSATKITSIGTWAFAQNPLLKEVILPNTLKTIGGYAFYYTTADSVEELVVNLGNGVTTIGEHAFHNNKIKSITIPASVTTIEEGSFYTNDAINVTIEDSETPLTFHRNGSKDHFFNSATAYVGRNIIRTGAAATLPVFNYPSLTSLTIGPKVTAIGDFEYISCTSLLNVSGLANVVSIGDRAFDNCQNLMSIEIGNKLTTLGDRVFSSCLKLESISLPGSLKVIPEASFMGCHALASVTLDDGIEEIGNGAFYDTKSLTEIIIPASVKKIGRAPFYCDDVYTMKRMIIADSDTPLEFVNSITEMNGWGTDRITDDYLDYFYLGRNVIWTSTNSSYSMIFSSKEIEIGDKVTDIGTLFEHTYGPVEKVRVHWTTPIAINANAFHNNIYNNATLLVPGGTMVAYKAEDNNWKLFKNMDFASFVVSITAAGHGILAVADIEAGNGEIKTTLIDRESDAVFAIMPEVGYELTAFTVNGKAQTLINGHYTVPNLQADQTAIATFAPISYTLTYNLAGGSVTGLPANYTIESAAFTLPQPTRTGYNFAGWIGTGLSVATKTVTIAKGSTGNRTFTATWTPIVYSITYDLAGGSVATANPTTYTIETPSFTLSNPTMAHYTFAGWKGTGLSTATTTVTVAKGNTGNRSYIATWEKEIYTVSITGAGVTASNMSPKYQESVTIAIATDPDRTLLKLTVNGTDVTEDIVDNTYTIVSVSSNINVVATFQSTKEFITMAHSQVTFSCSQALDFSSVDGLKAYIASGYNKTTGTVLLTRVESVPAGTGLLLVGTEGETYKVPYTENDNLYANFLKPVLIPTVVPQSEGSYTNYLYSSVNGVEGFYRSSGSGIVAAQKAYLQLSTASISDVKGVGFEFDDTLTHVNAVKADTVAPEGVYDIHGRKIPAGQQLRTGIYIVNGSKVVVK